MIVSTPPPPLLYSCGLALYSGFRPAINPTPFSRPAVAVLCVTVLQDTLVACLTDNPRPILFPVSCFGAVPRMVLEGPWDKALRVEQAALDGLGNPEVGRSPLSQGR